LWSIQGRRLQKFEGHRASISNIHFSPDGNWLLTSSLDGTARLWDLQGKQWAEYPGHDGSGLWDAVFSPDGQQVATISLDGYVQLWPVESFNQLVEKGCNWLADYLAIHPEAQKQLTVCHLQ
jgi:WD40 repeat protein